MNRIAPGLTCLALLCLSPIAASGQDTRIGFGIGLGSSAFGLNALDLAFETPISV